MDQFTIEERLERLSIDQIKELIDYLFRLSTTKEKIDFNSLPREYNGLLRHFSKLSNQDKSIFLGYVRSYVKETNRISEDASRKLDATKEKVEDRYLSEASIRLNEKELTKRLAALSIKEKNSLAKSLVLISKGTEVDMESIESRTRGIVKGFCKFKNQERIKLLEMMRNQFITDALVSEDGAESLFEINIAILEVKKENITEMFRKMSNLSLESQMQFMEDVHRNSVESFARISKDDRIRKCSHDFGEWKDTSYTTIEEQIIDWQHFKAPVEHTRWTRKCKKCGYKEDVYEIPKEIVRKREEEATKKEIKRLEKKLKKLKG